MALRMKRTCGREDYHPATVPYVTPPALRLATTAATSGSRVVMERFPVTFEGYEYEGWIAYEKHAPPKPQVLVIPNYAGLKQVRAPPSELALRIPQPSRTPHTDTSFFACLWCPTT